MNHEPANGGYCLKFNEIIGGTESISLSRWPLINQEAVLLWADQVQWHTG